MGKPTYDTGYKTQTLSLIHASVKSGVISISDLEDVIQRALHKKQSIAKVTIQLQRTFKDNSIEMIDG